MNLTFTFTKEETELIINSLAKESYGSVFQLIQKIQAEAGKQINDQQNSESDKVSE